ncbi:amidohydrolase [Xylariales sp. PMI_506]|nr:amidohydrolase [Xylariales sp. PMI_506]
MSSGSILLQGGTLLLHDADNHVVPTVADLLVKGSKIFKIGKDISPEPDMEVFDCRTKIVSPGFIDTHRHLWQTQYKGSHANQTLIEYMVRGNFTSTLWSPEDLFWGQLSGALESIDAGTTTVVDHSSCNVTPQHTQAAIQALVSSGLRAVYCYTPPRRLISRDPWVVEDDAGADTLPKFHALARGGPYGSGRVDIGFANDNIYSPAGVIKPLYAALRDGSKGRAKIITSHTLGGPMQAGAAMTPVKILHSHGVLGPDVLLSHANWPQDGDGDLYRESGACVSTTPNTELQMGWQPVALHADHYDNASIGVDCHSCGAPGIPEQMRLLLQAARGARGAELAARGLWSLRTGYDAERVFNLGTLGGARACGLAGQVGSLREGMAADLVVFDTETPGMLAAAAEDPVAAIVLHSHPSDIDLVIIDGIVRKQGGKLVDVDVAAAVTAAPTNTTAETEQQVPPSQAVVEAGTRLSWKDIAGRVLESRKVLKKKADGIDFIKGEEMCMDKFFVNRETLLELV